MEKELGIPSSPPACSCVLAKNQGWTKLERARSCPLRMENAFTSTLASPAYPWQGFIRMAVLFIENGWSEVYHSGAFSYSTRRKHGWSKKLYPLSELQKVITGASLIDNNHRLYSMNYLVEFNTTKTKWHIEKSINRLLLNFHELNQRVGLVGSEYVLMEDASFSIDSAYIKST